ncbi:MAG: CTP synthase [Defluviitaleaceae bacterium]|nr:CTP synthase [Defluviitaleaceae bacterium]
MDKQTKYIFVTGGVASGLGKGITAASMGRLLKARGYKVANQKFDPYINIDPSLMSPIQHGEIFVTDDGAECDADVGHYERFTDESLTANSNITSGKIYQMVMQRERDGYYGGKTVQVVPHITDYIKTLTKNVAKERTPQPDVVITEIGGTAGDIESLPFMEAIRQMAFDVGRENVLYIHVTLLPYLEKGGEIKTKPTQHSVKTLLSLGIQPDIIVCRTSLSLDNDIRDKLSLFCNVAREAIIQNIDCDTIYEVPLLLEEENFAKVALTKLGLADKTPDLTDWKAMVEAGKNANEAVKISIVGKYTILPDAYLSLIEALKAASFAASSKVDINWVAAEQIEKGEFDLLKDSQGIIIANGFGERGSEGKILTAKFARENNIPCLGIGMGMQAMAIDFARHVMGLGDANSAEFNETTAHPIFFNPGTGLRKGAYDCTVAEGSLAHKIYGKAEISERHRHRYELDTDFVDKFEAAGMKISGRGASGQAEMLEVARHPFYLGVLFAPQFKSRPNRPHPIFAEFLAAAKDRL